MNTTLYRALVVDDEPAVRQATMRALSRTGFSCESAANGSEALELAKDARFDAVVTDLRMPEANGHQLAVELLEMPNRPAIVILTGVMEPRLANDLRLRGVDEILFKPIEFESLATKVRGLVDQRAASTLAKEAEATKSSAPAPADACEDKAATASHKALAAQIAKASSGLKNPPANFDAFARGSANIFSTRDLIKAVQSNPSFVAEVLRFANQLIYSSTKALSELQTSMAAIRRNSVSRALMIFVGGAIVGWLLSWLGPGGGFLR